MLHRADTGRRRATHNAGVRYVIVGLLCAAVLVATAAAQKKKQRGPRALALVQWVGSGPPRVIPISILVDGRYYDASIYMASPVPMALESGTVYEVEEGGESVGMATLTTAKQTQQGAWFADARYQSKAELAAPRRSRRAEKAAPPEEAGPPRLRRGPLPEAPTASSTPSPTQSSGSRGPDEPPVLHKPASETQTPQPSQPTAAERASAAQAAPAASGPALDESGRPILRRGRGSAEQAAALPGGVSMTAASKMPGAAASAPATTSKAPQTAGRVLAAISDAAGPEPHSYKFGWTAQEQQRLTSAMSARASSALADYARAHPGATPGQLEDVQVRAFDVAYNNSPDLVLTARAGEAPAPVRRARGETSVAVPPAPSAGVTYWVTLVARQDLNGDLRKLMFSVTDSKHLDAYPRLELIDAVDVDGDGRGELLFREISDVDRNYVIYRLTPDNLRELFNTAEQ